MMPQQSQGLWRNTPPAIFPPILGLFGIGLAWRRAAAVFPVPRSFGEMILGAISLLFVFAVIAYFAKVVRRPGAMVDDLRTLPGRAGLSTLGMAGMLFAAVLVPYSGSAAKTVLVLAVAVHVAVIILILSLLWGAPLAQRRMTPVWHLTFVGLIVAAVPGAMLHWDVLSDADLFVTMALAFTIWGGSLVMLARGKGVPAPLRPPLAIHLAPAALFGIVSAGLGYTALPLVFGWVAIGILAVLLLRVRYLTEAGFSPFWGAFTFPIAAFANLMLILALQHGGLFRPLSGLALVAGSIAIPLIAIEILKMWASRKLATKTNASSV